MKKFVCFLMVLCSFCICGCSPKYDKSIDTIQNTINYVQSKINDIDTSTDNYNLKYKKVDENFEGTGYDGSSFVNGKNYSKQSKNNLDSSIYNTVFLVNTIKSKGFILLGMCDIMKDKSIKINKNVSSAIIHFCDSIKVNADLINGDKNKTTKYIDVVDGFDTNNSYLSSICYGFDNIYNTIEYFVKFDNVKPVKKNKKQKSWNNVDGYINKNNYGYGNTNPYYNNFRYNKMPYYGYGMNNMRNFYPYSPYSGYNPYMPNIDTFGSYSNIDTFKPFNDDFYYNYEPYLPVHKCEDKNKEKEEKFFKNDSNIISLEKEKSNEKKDTK